MFVTAWGARRARARGRGGAGAPGSNPELTYPRAPAARQIFLRGAYVRDAAAAMLLGLGLANASALVVSGTSAGGLAALAQVDW